MQFKKYLEQNLTGMKIALIGDKAGNSSMQKNVKVCPIDWAMG